MKKPILIFALGAIIIGGGAFYGGMKYQQNKTSQNRQRFQEEGMSGGNFRIRNGSGPSGRQGGFLGGEVLAKDDNSLTLKMRDGGSRIVFFNDSTEMAKNVKGSKEDLKVGQRVSVSGNLNGDGSFTAELIQVKTDFSSN